MPILHFLDATYAVMAVIWPYLLFLLVLMTLARVGQFNDLLRRELRSPVSALLFSLVLGVLGFLALFAMNTELIRVAVHKTGIEGLHFSKSITDNLDFVRIAVFIGGVLMLARIHYLVHYNLRADVFGVKGYIWHSWKILMPIIGIVAALLVIKTSPRPFLYAESIGIVNKPLLVDENMANMSLVIVALCYIAIGVTFMFPRALAGAAPDIARYSLSVVHFVIALLMAGTFMARVSALEGGVYHGLASVAVIWVVVVLIYQVLGVYRNDSRRIAPADLISLERCTVAEALERRFGKTPPPSLIIFVAEGGGAHAAYRSANLLAELNEMAPDFWSRVFATSTVSGGSVGTSIFSALNEELADDRAATRRCASIASRADLLTPLLARMLFSEPLAFLLPTSIHTDRGKALEIAMTAAVQKAQPGAAGNLVMSMTAASESRRFPYFCFNTTSTKSGDRFVLSNLKLSAVRTLANYPYSQDITLCAASGLSARYPIITGSGRIRTGCEKSGNAIYERVIDGGLYDNSGIMTAMDLVGEIRAAPGYEHVKILMIVVGNSFQLRSKLPLRRNVAPDKAFAEVMSLFTTTIGALYRKNEEYGFDLKDFSEKQEVEIAHFPWWGQAMRVPLGWYINSERQRAISFMLGLKSYLYLGTKGNVEEDLDELYYKSHERFPFEEGKEKACLTPPHTGALKFLTTRVAEQVGELRMFNKKSLIQVKTFVDNPARSAEDVESAFELLKQGEETKYRSQA